MANLSSALLELPDLLSNLSNRFELWEAELDHLSTGHASLYLRGARQEVSRQCMDRGTSADRRLVREGLQGMIRLCWHDDCADSRKRMTERRSFR